MWGIVHTIHTISMQVLWGANMLFFSDYELFKVFYPMKSLTGVQTDKNTGWMSNGQTNWLTNLSINLLYWLANNFMENCIWKKNCHRNWCNLFLYSSQHLCWDNNRCCSLALLVWAGHKSKLCKRGLTNSQLHWNVSVQVLSYRLHITPSNSVMLEVYY